MKNLFLAVSVGLLFGIFSINAQNPSRTPTPAEEARTQAARMTEEAARIARERQKTFEDFNRLKNVNQSARLPSNASQRRMTTPQQQITALYREPTREELKTLSPKVEDTNRYANFLRQPNTGLTKLAADLGCAENIKIVVATPDCLQYTMPGAGSSFSFRTRNYRIPRLADLTFTDNSFQATGNLIHGIFVKIGDVELQKVDLNTKGLNFLANFQPEAEYEKAKIIDRKLSEGIFKDGFQYRRGFYAVENTTYVLRSIAYNGKYYRAVVGGAFNEFDFDKRFDIIVAFRIVRKDSDGSVTILWKELSRKDSPKIKYQKRQDKTKPDKNKFLAKEIL